MSSNEALLLRFFSSDGERSTTIACDENTTIQKVCTSFSCDSVSALIGNFHFRQLEHHATPMDVIYDFCATLADGEFIEDLLLSAHSPSFRHLFAFFLGRGRLNVKSHTEVLVEDCLVRRGRLVHTWASCKAYFYNTTIRLRNEEDEESSLDLRVMQVDMHQSRKGLCLRVQDAKSVFLLLFCRPESISSWLTRAQQAQKFASLDLSDGHLTLIPENVINDGTRIEALNLRRNSLTTRSLGKTTPIGFVDDLSRLQNLTALDLSFNRIAAFPNNLVFLPKLVKLNLSSNFIASLSKDIRNMRNLKYFDLSNNLLEYVPPEFEACRSLVHLDLSFNRLTKVPDCFGRMPSLMNWNLVGNYISSVDEDQLSEAVQKVVLRRNVLGSTFRLACDTLTFVDIRDNPMVSTVNLTSLHNLRVLHCEHLQLTCLQLNGQSLTHLYADHNLLDTIVVMPLPQHATVLSLSHNALRSLPDWVADLPHLTFLRVNNNFLDRLPQRLFCSLSLRCLFAFDNRIEYLPDEFGENCLESLILYRNLLRSLPVGLFQKCRRLRQLNVSSNMLKTLPPLDAELSRLQILRVASNNLDESSVPTIVNMKQLKTLDISDNSFKSFDDSALSSLSLLEEVSLSSNKISRLSVSFGVLPSLQILRAHSNLIEVLPDFSRSTTLHTLDVCSNCIAAQTLQFESPSTLRTFDVSGNSGFTVLSAGRTLRAKRRLEVVDLSNRVHGFSVGCSESSGAKNKLCVRCLRVGNVWAMVDGGCNSQLPNSILRFLNNCININEDFDLRRILLRCHCALGEEGERLGASVVLMRIGAKNLEIATSGTIGVAVVRNNTLQRVFDGRYEIDDEEYSRLRQAHGFVDDTNLINGVARCSRQIGHYALFPLVTPSPSTFSISVEDGFQGVVVANSPFWKSVGGEDVLRTFNSTNNALLTAKKLQDKLQSFDYAGNSNIIVAKLTKPQMSFTALPCRVITEKDSKTSRSALSSAMDGKIEDEKIATPPPLPITSPPEPVFSKLARARANFHQKRDIISKSLNFTPPNAATFQI